MTESDDGKDMERKDDVYEIDLLKIAKILLRKLSLIVVITVFCAIVALAGSLKLIAPKYTASIYMYVNNSSFSIGSSSVSISSGDITAAKSLVSTYCTILRTRLTLEEVIEQAELDYTYEELNNIITAGAVNSTEIFKISVETPDPVLSCKIANTIAKVLPAKISSVVDGSSVRVVDLAIVPKTVSSPNYYRFGVIGGLLGFIVTVASIVIYSLINERIDSEEWISENFGDKYPVLAVIPDELAVEVETERYAKYGKYKLYNRYSSYKYGRYGQYGYSNYSNYYAEYNKQTKKSEKDYKKEDK